MNNEWNNKFIELIDWTDYFTNLLKIFWIWISLSYTYTLDIELTLWLLIAASFWIITGLIYKNKLILNKN